MNLRTSGVIGAPPQMATRTWSRPSASRILDRTCSSARRYASVSPAGTGPACAASTYWRATASASCTACCLAWSGSRVTRAPAPASSFSHTRGTPKKKVGRASVSAPGSAFGSASAVTCMPPNIAR